MKPTEQRLAERLKKGDAAALEKIIDSFSGYVCTVIRNFSRGAFSEQDIDELCADDFSIEEAAERNEMMSALYEALETFSETEREIFLRFYFYGEKSSEIAIKTGTAESSVRSKLSRTRTKLREYLTKRGFDHV